VCHFFIIIVIRHETTAAACRALLLIIRTLFDDAITVAVWTGFHVRLSVALSSKASHGLVYNRGF
jgi:hypothetical protein